MDYRLTRWVDDDGQLWQVCMICTEPTREQDLAIDPADGLRWDICAECQRKEEEWKKNNSTTESQDGQ